MRLTASYRRCVRPCGWILLDAVVPYARKSARQVRPGGRYFCATCARALAKSPEEAPINIIARLERALIGHFPSEKAARARDTNMVGLMSGSVKSPVAA